jgi:hypothetical protein
MNTTDRFQIAQQIASRAFGDGNRFTVLEPDGTVIRTRSQDAAETSDTRARDRAVTYEGIARAMAEQWG